MKNLKTFFIASIVAITITNSASCKKDEPKVDTPIIVAEVSSVTDYDGNTYRTVKIGDQVWMAENFNASKTSNGQSLLEVYEYNNDSTNSNDYGRLYSWSAAVMAAPEGWHLPTKEEWEELINSVGGPGIAGGKLKESGTTHWNSPNTGAENSVGFSAVAGGFRGGDGVYYVLGEHGSYWGTANNAQDPYCIYVYNTTANLVTEVSPVDKTSGNAFAVRFVKN
ncbi:MAG: hypothetical protein A2W85_13700 [Bacteroidetes bacterium GWF2_41_31]|nr:MAG: hypothetical protein A2W85_13700 [Bacteroidetes bacterium GWF2_41_31]